MNTAINRVRRAVLAESEERPEPQLFSSAFGELGVDPAMLASWGVRAAELGASPLPAAMGAGMLQALWSRDKYMSRLDVKAIARLERFFEFAVVPAGRDIIEQDEYGNFMIVLLSGSIAVDRRQPGGEQKRMAQVQPGEILGEMSLLDSGLRFARCTTLADCEVGALDAPALDHMMVSDPELAASLIAVLARRLSLRLRVVGAGVWARQTLK